METRGVDCVSRHRSFRAPFQTILTGFSQPRTALRSTGTTMANTAKDAADENTGAWIIHHGQKLQADVSGASEFSALDGAAKGGMLLAGMAASDQTELSRAELVAIAKNTRLNPKTELDFALEALRKREVIDVTKEGAVSVLGVSSRQVLRVTTRLFEGLDPTAEENAAIDVAETTSAAPKKLGDEIDRVSDAYKLKRSDAADFLRRSQEIGFVDSEGDGADRLLFNGNLFRRNGVAKSKLILESLKPAESALVADVADRLSRTGCLEVATVRAVLSDALFDKLRAAGFYDVNTVSNDQGNYSYVTAPAAFHKFVNPFVDDAFDMAKALVAALSYGITRSSTGRGRIMMPAVLIGKLVSGREIGPATAIGEDYRVLELKRVIQLRRATGSMYYMRLLKRDVGELALQVLTQGGTPTNVLGTPATAAMSGYTGPEQDRSNMRRKQSAPSKKHTNDVLQTLREQGSSW